MNDSQGTQPDAVIAALRAFEPPVVLIAGGRDKGVDLDELAAVVAERAAAAVVIGETGPDLERRFRAAGLERVERASSMDDAVARADALAARRRSPACGRRRGSGDRPAEPGRRQLRHVPRLRRPWTGVQGRRRGRSQRPRARRDR